MNRKDAESLVGTTVGAWTALNGEYAGELVELVIQPRRPWRASVRITGVLAVAAVTYDRSGRQRWGKRIGDTIEVGGSSIMPVAADASTDLTYLTVLRNAKASREARIPEFEKGAAIFAARDDYWARRHLDTTLKDLRRTRWAIKELTALIEEEPARLAKMAKDKVPVASKRARDCTVGGRALAEAMVKDGIEAPGAWYPVTMVSERTGIITTEILVTGVKSGDTLFAAYWTVDGRVAALDLNEETLRES